MHIKDHNDAMKFFRTSRQEESNGKWQEFVQRSEFEDAFPEPPAMAEGGRIGLSDGQLVAPSVDGSRPGYGGKKYKWITIEGTKYPVFLEGPNKGKINWRTTRTVEGRPPMTVHTPISKEDLIKHLKSGLSHKIKEAVYSVKEATQLRADLPEGITLTKGAGKKGAYSYRVAWEPRGQGKKERIWRAATEENIEDLIKRQKAHLKKNYPNILSNEAFENLRMNDENINLNKKEFAEKLNKLGHKTYHNLEWNAKNVSNIETSLDIHKLTNPEYTRIRSISEAKNIIREKQGGNVWLKETMNKPKEIRDAEIRTKANQLLGQEYTRKKMGIFAHTQTKEAQMFKNWFAAVKTGYSDRIQIGGKFDGKDLRHRRNWPKNADGSVNWQAIGKDGKPAWQSVEFTDTKVPDGKGGFKETKFTWDKTVKNGNIGQQVDNAFGSGFFNKSTKAYDLQKLGSTKNIMFRGKSMSVSQAIAEKMIIDQYKLDNQGRMPTEDTIKRRRKTFSYDEVHHPRGVGNDPYFTENTFRTANRDLNYAEKTYKGKITEAGGNPRLLSEAKKDYIKNIEDISSKYGGIRAEVDGKMFGTKGTHPSITVSAGRETGLLKNKDFVKYVKGTFQSLSPRSIAQLTKEFPECGTKGKGGSIMTCLQGKFKADPEKFLQKAAPLAKGNPNLRQWFMRGRNIAKGTGIALAWEAAFAPIIIGWGKLEGASNQRIIHDLAYGSILEGVGVPPEYVPGQNLKEEFMEAGGDELSYKMQRMGELENQELPYLQQQRADVINKMANVEGKSFHQRTIEDDIKEKKLELQGLKNTPEFYEGPAASYYNEPVIQGAFDLEQQTAAKIAADTAERKKATFDWLEKNKIYDPNWHSQVQGSAEGGIASLNVKK